MKSEKEKYFVQPLIEMDGFQFFDNCFIAKLHAVTYHR